MNSILIMFWIYLLILAVNGGTISSSSDVTHRSPYETPYRQTQPPSLPRKNAKLYARIRTRVTNEREYGSHSFTPLNPNIGQQPSKPAWTHDGTVACPNGYRIRQYGGSVQCSPAMYPKHTGSKVLDCLVNPGCGASTRPIYRDTGCPAGTQKVISMGKIHCTGKRAHRFDTFTVYDMQQSSNKMPYNYQSVVQADPRVTNEISQCENGKVSARSENGYVCVDPVFPPSVCQDDRVPAMSPDGIQCIPCPFGTTKVRTPDGVRCEQVETPRPEPCPDGLQSVSTAVGRICQYVPEVNRQPYKEQTDDRSNPCKKSEILVVSQAGSACYATIKKNDFAHAQDLGDMACGYGNVLVLTAQRFSCFEGNIPAYIFPMCGSNFVLAKLHYEYKCISQVDARVECSDNEILSHVDNGFQCIEVQQSATNTQYPDLSTTEPLCGQYQHYDRYARRCVSYRKNILTNDIPIACPHGQTFSKLYRTCVPGYQCFPGQMFGKLTGACVSETRCPLGHTFSKLAGRCITDKRCKPGEMFNPETRTCMTSGQTRIESRKQCDRGQVVHTDEGGRPHCISLDDATDLCGDGYKAVEANVGFVCKLERQNVICPHSHTLTTMNGRTLCVKGTCSQPIFHHLGADNRAGCHQLLPECEDNYILKNGVDGPQCVLNVIQPSLDQSTDLCNGDASMRPCDVPADILLQQCNPGCANGGTCVNRTCVCPPGIAGHSCHLDVDECQTHTCDYKCVNTFGSFHCICPAGMGLALDGVACQAIGCVKPCLNNGTCRDGNCVCSDGFEGEHCEIDKDECALYGRRLCQFQCRNTYGGYQCICPPGSRLNTDGRTCINTTCIPECRNGGTCRDHRCQCPRAFYGSVCQFDVNECIHKMPCEQICSNSWGSYHCSCRQGYTLQSDNRTCKQNAGS